MVLCTNDFHETEKLNRIMVRLISLFKNAQRIGNSEDNPEGTRYIQMSDTLANELLRELIDLGF